MSYASTTRGTSASYALATERATFIRRTYMHLGGAIALFVALNLKSHGGSQFLIYGPF